MKTIQKFKTMLALFVFAATVLLSGMQCEKEQELPAATQTGKNTFGYKINGEIVVPKKGWAPGLPLSQEAIYYYNFSTNSYDVLINSVHTANKPYRYLHISTKEILLEEKTYEIGEENITNVFYANYSFTDSPTYATSAQAKGQINITHFDEINRIISGTFWFDALDPNGVKVEIREGRFDVHFIK
jgi:hypothetical protein